MRHLISLVYFFIEPLSEAFAKAYMWLSCDYHVTWLIGWPTKILSIFGNPDNCKKKKAAGTVRDARWFSRWRKFFRETKIINNINKILDKKAIIFINRRTVEFNCKTTPLNHDKLKLYKIAHCTKLHRWNAHVMLYIMLKSIRATSIQFWILQREINQIWTSLISNGFSFFQVQESVFSSYVERFQI